MRKLALALGLSSLLALCFTQPSCTGNNTSSSTDSVTGQVSENKESSTKHSTYGLSFDLPSFYEYPDYTIDISNYTYEELVILRSVPYARNGHWFKEGEINEKFNAIRQYKIDLKTVVKAYAQDSLCHRKSKYWKAWENNYPQTYGMIKLNAEETAFVKRVDARIAEIRKTKFVTTEGLKLCNVDLLINQSYIENMTPELMEKLRTYNFAISEAKYQQLFNSYEKWCYDYTPSYVTTDLYLQAYHMYFSWLLKRLELVYFLPAIEAFSNDMFKQCLVGVDTAKTEDEKALAEFATSYFAVASHLATDKEVEGLPDNLSDTYKSEAKNCYAEADGSSPLLNIGIEDENIFPYSLFKPRGNYSRNDTTKRYFRSMMWMQSAWLCLETDQGLQRALYLALAYNKASQKTRDLCNKVYAPLEFLMGQPDNIAIIELAKLTEELGINQTSDLLDRSKLANFREIINSKTFGAGNKIKPKSEELMACKNKINLMPQRYVPDNEVLALMYDEKANSDRAFPCGLDVMDAFGSTAAANILDSTDHAAKKWKDYGKYRTLARKKFRQFTEYDKTMYNKWLESLVVLQNNDKNAPSYTKTSAWQKKNVNTALASWAELKHDAILYAEQPMGAEMGDGGDDYISLPDPVFVQNYLEPNLPFWKKLKEMLILNTNILKNAGYYEDEWIKKNTKSLLHMIEDNIVITEKELKDKPLSITENLYLQNIGGSMENFTLSVIDPIKELYEWFEVKGPDTCIAQVADVFTRNIPNCGKNGILHVATGKANEIFVVVERQGKVYITRGAVFDYYEFVEKGNRLTDEEWQIRLAENKQQGRPSWMSSLMTENEVKTNRKSGTRYSYPAWLLDYHNYQPGEELLDPSDIMAPDDTYND
ncbi:MAG: DUF3160 domain-containing protein [Paludibacteraceae bacterium]|nr:DUF3160 domain-containing protein [Paludibacteraceae bacterium]